MKSRYCTATSRRALRIALLILLVRAPFSGFVTYWGKRQCHGICSLRALADAKEMQKGIDQAVEKGLLPAEAPSVTVQPVDDADEVLSAVGDAGGVIALQGEPSTKKADLVAALKGKGVEVWKLETFFRAMTFLLLTVTEQTGSSLESVLQRPEMLAAGIEMIEEMREGKSVASMAEQAESMMSMSSDTSKIEENLPLAVGFGTGEVINFAISALKSRKEGSSVLIDGTGEALRYIPASHRFEVKP